MTSLKRMVVVVAGATFLLAACSDGSVDREGARDDIVQVLRDAGLTVDAGCIDEVFDKYSDDELKALNKALGEDKRSEATTQLVSELTACAKQGG